MTAIAGILGAASIVAWVGAVVDIGKALSGGSWAAAAGSLVLAVVLSAAGGVVRGLARSGEQRRLASTLERAAASSPRLADEIEDLASARYQQSTHPPIGHPTPVDIGGTTLLLLSWASMIGGIVLATIGLVFLHSFGMIVSGAVLLLLVGPLHAGQKRSFAARVLDVYERELLPGYITEPPFELRMSLWATAQMLARPTSDSNVRVSHMIEAYALLVGAWSEDQRPVAASNG